MIFWPIAQLVERLTDTEHLLKRVFKLIRMSLVRAQVGQPRSVNIDLVMPRFVVGFKVVRIRHRAPTQESRMKNVALVYLSNIQSFDYDGYSTSQLVATSIVDWKEVSDEEYQLLVGYALRTRKFVVVERPPHDVEDNLIVRSVADQIAYLQREEQRRAAEEAARVKAERERKAKRAATALVRKQKQLEKLRKELEAAGQTV